MTTARTAAGRIRQPRIVIVGAGMSGICMGITLTRAGFENFTILEKGTSVGGTWRDNRYPGLTCDVPSYLYQYTFDLNPGWKRLFSSGPQIQKYFVDAAEQFGLGTHTRLGVEVSSAIHDGRQWRVTTADGDEYFADFVLFATGVLHHPVMPAIAGRDDFDGPLFHSARWDDSVSLEGKRVGIVGTGSTGVQIFSALAGVASQTTMFARTPQWVFRLPNPRQLAPVTAALRRFEALDRLLYRGSAIGFSTMSAATVRPSLQRKVVQALCRVNLRSVRDPELRQRLTPDYQPLCKRLIMHPDFYRKVQRDDVEVVTDAIDHLDARGIVTADGQLREFDVIVFATGFDSHAYLRPIRIEAADGTTLAQAWNHGPRAYRSVGIPGLPNLFMLMGPHSPVGNFSLVPIAEAQANYALGWIEKWSRGRYDTLSPTKAATDEHNAMLRRAMPNTVWATGCDSWYLDEDGLPELWPFSPFRYERLMRESDGMNLEFDKAGMHV